MEKVTYSQEVRALLVACNLPVADLQDDGEVCFFGLRHRSELLGVVGVEIRGDYGLLRSLAISATHRGSGLGQKLVAYSEEWATRAGLKALYLLTTTADHFFERLGYKELNRVDSPSAITQTQQFSGLCPDSSIFMGKGLGAHQALCKHGGCSISSWRLSHSYDYQGQEVRYGRLGKGPPMVFVHGTPWSSFNLRHLIRKLSKEYTVYFFDLLGYGQSSTTKGDVSLGVQNVVLDKLLAHWELDDPIIVGHDFGGATALRTHLINERAFKKIILIDPVAISPWGSPFFRHVNRYEAAFSGMPDYIHDAVVRSYVQTAAFTPLDEATLEGIVSPWTGKQGKAAFYRQMAQADSKYTDEVQPLYPTITIPTLILWGREDNWIPLARGEELRDMIPGSCLRVIDNAGHLVIEERPEELVKEILNFVKV